MFLIVFICESRSSLVNLFVSLFTCVLFYFFPSFISLFCVGVSLFVLESVCLLFGESVCLFEFVCLWNDNTTRNKRSSLCLAYVHAYNYFTSTCWI